MESVLKCLVRDSQALGRGFGHIKQLSQTSLDLLESQSGLMQSTPFELREKCLAAFHAALISSSGHLLKLGLLGLQKMLRDNHFTSKHCDPPDDQQWLLSQLLDCLAFPNWTKVSEEVQIEICKILISFACLDPKYLHLNAHVEVDLLTRCLDMGLSGGIRSRKHQAALQTSAVQNLAAFARYAGSRYNYGDERKELSDTCDVNQVVPIIQYLCDKLEDGLATGQPFLVEFGLEAVLALLANLPDGILLNSRSHCFVWRTLCPTLLKLVGLPVMPGVQVVDNRVSELRNVASIGGELLRLFGNVALLRAPLESLFHRLLVHQNNPTRLELLKTIKEVFSNCQRLLVIGGPFLEDICQEEIVPEPNEFGILRILFDAMEDSAQQSDSCPELKLLVLSCTNAVLSSLLSFSGSPGPSQISDAYAEKINSLYLDMDSCDYIGALSYPSRLRLPKTYQQLLESSSSSTSQQHVIEHQLPTMSEEQNEEDQDDSGTSTTSGVTEGPEGMDQKDLNHECELVDRDEEIDSVERFEASNNGSGVRNSHVDSERLAARQFLKDLQAFLPSLSYHRSPLEVDIALQQFASNYCEESRQAKVVYNADGLYLTVYVALLLNLELAKRGYYPECTGFVAQSEEDFVSSVINSGVLVILTPEFLAEIYQGILVTDLLGLAGFNSCKTDFSSSLSSCAFINLLTDVRQVKSSEEASCFLSDCRKLHFAFTPNFLLREPRRQAGLKFSRRFLTCFWDSFLFIYSNAIGPSPSANEGDDQAIQLGLDGLQNAAKLANILGLQDRSGTIFSLLASLASGNPRLSGDLSCLRQKKFRTMNGRLVKARLMGLLSRPLLDIGLAHILSLDLVLNKGLELASYNKEAWTHILRCCLFVTELERRLYKSRQVDKMRMTTQLKQYTAKLKWKLSQAREGQTAGNDDLDLSTATFGGLDEDSCNTDSYSFLTAASQLPANDNDIQQLLDKVVKSEAYKNSGQLDEKLVARIVGLLSDRVNLLLEDAAAKLNLKSLLLLIDELCQLCRVQLLHLDEDNISLQCHWVLHRIGEVMLRSVKTGRPLYHALHCWAIVGPTLLKAACCRDPAVAKTSVEILRSVISHVLQEQPEPRHFHFNEALFKPFEHLLCRQNCDPDLLDQVMSSLCELVECWSGEIRSGWRPLFACLCRWPPPAQEPLESCSSNQRIHAENIATVKEVLAAFVHQGASQPLVFANAAMDAILCQLHYLKSYRFVAELSGTAIDYLQQFAKLLIQLCPAGNRTQQSPVVFFSALSLTFVGNECDFEPLLAIALEHRDVMEAEDQWSVLFRHLSSEPIVMESTVRPLWEEPTGVYKVFYLLVDGVTCCITHSKDPVQKSIGEVVHGILTLLIDAKEYDFVLMCLRCSIIPGMSHWLNRLSQDDRKDHFTQQAAGLSSFKQMCGLLCDIVTALFSVGNPEESDSAKGPSDDQLRALFRQTVLLYVHCAVQEGSESLVRIGNSCFRHLVLNCGERFQPSAGQSNQLWDLTVSALCLIVRCNLSTVQRLIQEGRVAEGPQLEPQLVRQHPFRLQHLSRQVFSLDVDDETNRNHDNGSKILVALLSYQLAFNLIANVISCSNTLLSEGDEVWSLALFAENMQKCAAFGPRQLAGLVDTLRTGCEFGLDFEVAPDVRAYLQGTLGLSRPPSLSRVTSLASNLLLVALINAAPFSDRYMRELEQWLDFLLDFYFQESYGSTPTQTDIATKESAMTGNDVKEERKDQMSISPTLNEEEVKEEEPFGELEISTTLEAFRKQKRSNTNGTNTGENSPKREEKEGATLSRVLLLSAIQLLSKLKKGSQPDFSIVWNILSRIRLHCSDHQLRQAHENFEIRFALPSEDLPGDLEAPE